MMRELRPAEFARELESRVCGQETAIRAISVALRNRWRTQKANTTDPDQPGFNYLVTGPKGSGKSLIVRQAAFIAGVPFARTTFLQLAAAGSAGRARKQTFEALLTDARRHATDDATALRIAEQQGIVLIDGIDFWTGPNDETSAEPLEIAQRALFQVASGRSTKTSIGTMETSDIMIFATGDVTTGRQVDIPSELRMLFPRRIELQSLGLNELIAILEHPSCSPLRTFGDVLKADGIDVVFAPDAVEEIANEAAERNRRMEDHGARRLFEVLETVLDDALFDGLGEGVSSLVIDADYVSERCGRDPDDEGLDDFIL